MSDDLRLAIEASKKAGEIILQGFNSTHNISEKENKSIVTETDKNAEEVIIALLEPKSSYPILSEETRSTTSTEGTYWAVDPLDGTTNFSRGIPFCAVSIALIKDGVPVIGVVYNPLSDELYYGEKGGGSFLNDKKITVSHEKKLIFVNTGYNLEHKEKYIQATSLTAKNYTLRKMGSTACELALIARGSSDGFVCWGDSLWDHAAGILLIREAGGVVTDWKGKEWAPDTNYILAGNKDIHADLLKIVSSL